MNMASLMVPGMAVDLFVHYVELFWIHWVSCGGAVKVDGGRGLEMFLYSSPNALPDSPM